MTSSPRVADRPVVGRGPERGRIDRLLDDGGRVVLVGDAGIGKTTIWRDGVALARDRGFLVLSAAPAEAEQTFSYAVLGDLVAPVADDVLDLLPAPQRRALDAALLKTDEAGQADVHTVGVAFGSVLKLLSGPVLVAIDDVQWADGASAAALDFALRRLGAVPCLFALRHGTASRLKLPADEIVVGPLSVGAIHHLLVERLGVALSRPALLRIHELSGGNPFYALELARSDSNLPSSLRELVIERVGVLPSETRQALATLALAGTGHPEAELAPAVDAGVLVVTGGQVRFAHPLLAEAAVELLDAGDRRSLHRQIASGTDDPEQRARHLAMAAAGPDEEIAALVSAAARTSARSRIAAAELWELAAGLTPPDRTELAAERRCEAGIAHVLAGNPDHGAALLEANLDRLPPGTLRSRGLAHLAFMLGRQDLTLIVDGLQAAIAEIEDLAVASELTGLLCGTVAATGDVVRAAQIADDLLAAVERDGAETLLASALTTAAVFRLTLDRPAGDLVDRARALDPQVAERAILFANMRDGRIAEVRAALEHSLARSAQLTIYAYHGFVSNLAQAELAAGRWERAEAYADEALTIGEQIDAPYMVSIGLTCSATVDALCGRSGPAREKLLRALEISERIRAGMHVEYALQALGLLELSLGRVDEATAAYRRVPLQGWHRHVWSVGGRPAADAVEALIAVGDTERAREVAAGVPVEAHERAAVDACLAAAEGDLERAVELLRAAEPSPAPFRRARELLLLGRILRQARHRSEARQALTKARDLFEELGAALWTERAREELSRLGGRRPAGSALTASERRVAELVAEGLSNKEVAVRLVVAVRTVEAHLSKIYAKLGVRSRTELAAAWKHDQASE